MRELPGCVVSSGSPDKGPQTGRLRPHVFIPHSLEAGHPTSRCCQGLVPPEASLLGLETPPCPCDLTPHRDTGPVGSEPTLVTSFHALEKEKATHSSVLAWRIPGMAEPGGLAVYGVAQSQTRLKRLSSSSSSISDLLLT